MGTRLYERIVVGVVLPEDDRLAGKAMSMAASLESVGSLCDFVTVDEKTAENGLENGEFYAVMKIPEGLIESIMDGTNLPVRVVFPGEGFCRGPYFPGTDRGRGGNSWLCSGRNLCRRSGDPDCGRRHGSFSGEKAGSGCLSGAGFK